MYKLDTEARRRAMQIRTRYNSHFREQVTSVLSRSKMLKCAEVLEAMWYHDYTFFSTAPCSYSYGDVCNNSYTIGDPFSF